MIYLFEPNSVYDFNRPNVLYENVFADGTLTGDEAAGFTVANAISGSTYDHWKPATSAESEMKVVLSAQTYANCLFMDAHELGSVGASFKLQVSANGGSSWTDVFDWVAPVNDDPIMVMFGRKQGDAYRLLQKDGPSSIGVVLLGMKLAFKYGMADLVTFRHGKTYDLMGGDSLSGQFLGQKVTRTGGSTSMDFPWMEYDWFNDNMSDFQLHFNTGRPFGMALNPEYNRDELAYCWRSQNSSELSPVSQQNGKAVSFSMGVEYFAG